MKIIEVVPNPYIALDKDGVPQGVVGAGMPGIFIGAQLDLVATRKTGKQRFFFPLEEGKLAKKVVFSADIISAVQAGELLAVSKADALLCGITAKEYLEPEAALAAEREKALAYYQAKHGPDAKLADIPREATPEEGTAPVQTSSKQITPTVKLAKNTEA